MKSLLSRAWVWWTHLGKLHYTQDLGPIVRVDTFWWGDVLIRECSKCKRHFVDFGSGI